jgi:Leucine-rich repeat (LRR) protein
MENVVAKPMNELAVRNAKYAAECTELHLANKNISLLADRVNNNDQNEFDRFVNLEVLWCNNNKLTRLEGLDMNFRLKHIYAQNNKIATLKVHQLILISFPSFSPPFRLMVLIPSNMCSVFVCYFFLFKMYIFSVQDSSISEMTFLHTLNLSSNNLTDLKATLEVLQRRKHLKELNLNDNPIAEEKVRRRENTLFGCFCPHTRTPHIMKRLFAS